MIHSLQHDQLQPTSAILQSWLHIYHMPQHEAWSSPGQQ